MAHNAADHISLPLYLSKAALPPANIDPDLTPKRGASWPDSEGFSLSKGMHRQLQRVEELPLRELELAVKCFRPVIDKVKVDLNAVTLPVPAIKEWDKEARAKLDVTDECSFRHYLQRFPFETAAAAVRAIDGVSTLDNRYAKYHFERFKFAVIPSGEDLLKYYLFGPPLESLLYPNRSPEIERTVTPGIVIITLPPWMFGPEDFEEFTASGAYEDGAIDRDNAKHPGWLNSTKLAAALHDICRQYHYRRFVVTTYSYWAFGTWSLDWSTIQVTSPIVAEKTKEVTLIEMLVFWTQCARQRDAYWSLAPDML
ncbi:hypothetical protein BD309DRAFT_990138 [Dichomitus squalens]|nr:uncharacterized protein DICSQDRAFT_183477 [Dichomitus squalens LYAD-421 SS1]EJF56996.1 hypothetical protein DICSQDRAFT_183477 [Dichomitus squalens LYAD-421 SS1]TBU44643.1 hypothetical protein BD309DRAFT_990138 [Dichomitus squalens]